MNEGTIIVFVIWTIVTAILFYWAGTIDIKNKIAKLLLEQIQEKASIQPQVAKAYVDILPNVTGEKSTEMLHGLGNEAKSRLIERLTDDSEAYFQSGNFQTSFERAKEACAVDPYPPPLAVLLKNRAEAMIKFEQTILGLPARRLQILEEAHKLAGDYEIPGFAERRKEIIAALVKEDNNESEQRNAG